MSERSEQSHEPERRVWVSLTRRKFIGAAGLAAAGLATGSLLEACGGETATPSTTPGSVPSPRQGASIRLLQWVHFVPAADNEFIRQCNEFGDKFGVKVAVERITADQLQTKTAAAVEASNGPDIIQMQYGWPHLYSAQCEDVTKEVNLLRQRLGAVAQVNDAFTKVDGVYRAIPYTVVPNAWSYRTDYFEKAGISGFPKTWDDLTQACAKLKAAGLPPIAQTDGHAYGDSLTMWNPVLWSFDPDNNQAYHADRISATLNGASIYIREKGEFHHFDKVTDNAIVPAGPKGTFTMNLIFNHAVMKYSPEKDTAKALILYLMEKDNYFKYTKVAGGYNAGPFAAFDNDPVFTAPDADPKMKPYQQVVKPGKWPGWPAPPSKKSSQAQTQYIVADMFAKSLQAGGTGDMEAAIKEAEARLKAIFERPT